MIVERSELLKEKNDLREICVIGVGNVSVNQDPGRWGNHDPPVESAGLLRTMLSEAGPVIVERSESGGKREGLFL